MRAALAVNPVISDINVNLVRIRSLLTRAAVRGANLVVFPETALTGLAISGDPKRDLPLGQEIPGRVTDMLGELSRRRNIWLAIGLLEREKTSLYDSALLFTPEGEIGLKYRRITPGWHAADADPEAYRQGNDVSKLQTPYGSVSLAVCSDLFDPVVCEKIKSLNPDYLLAPLARNFDDNSIDQARWDGEIIPEYSDLVKTLGTNTLIVNYLDSDGIGHDRCFGGALAFLPDGSALEELPLGQSGLLMADFVTV